MRTIKTAVITGGTGTVGTALAEHLAESGVSVTVLCRQNSSRRNHIPNHKNVKIVDADLEQLSELNQEQLGSADAFFHLAWMGTTGASRNDMALQNKNVQYALDAVELAHRLGCKVFLGAGSQAEYGRCEGKLSAETPAFPENGYGIAKLCAGQMTRIACKQHDIAHIWVRILSIYGPFDTPNSLIMSCVNALLDGQAPNCTKGEQNWDYLFSKDAAKALFLAAQKGQDGAVYPVGSGKTMLLKEYIYQLRDAVDPTLQVHLGAIPYPEKQVMYLCADIEQLTKDTGFVPETPFEQGIAQTVSWVRGVRK